MSNFQKYLDMKLKTVELKDFETNYVVESYDIYSEIRAAIVSLRRENHLTQKELAARTGITQANISKMEKGITKPTIDSLMKIAEATGTRLTINFLEQGVE